MFFLIIFLNIYFVLAIPLGKRTTRKSRTKSVWKKEKTDKTNIFGFLIKPKGSENSSNKKKVTETGLGGIMI